MKIEIKKLLDRGPSVSSDLENVISIFDRQPLTRTIVYGSPEYDAEVQRILEREAYGIRNTASDWNRLNEKATHRRSLVVFYWLLSKLGLGLIWAVSIFITIVPLVLILWTFNLIQ